MPDIGKDITKQQLNNYGNQQSPIGQLIGNILQRYMYQADKSGAEADQLLGGVGYGRANTNATPFYGGMYDNAGNPYDAPGTQHNPTAPGGTNTSTQSTSDGNANAGQGYHGAYNATPDNPYNDPDSKGAQSGGGATGDGEYGPGYNASDYQYPEGGAQGGIFGDLASDTGTDADARIADAFKWFRFGNADDTDLLSQFQNLADTGLYSQADDSASQNWAEIFKAGGASEEEANRMAQDIYNNPGKYEDQIGNAYGSLLEHPGFSDEEKTALEQEGMLSTRAATDAAKAEAMKRAGAGGGGTGAMAAIASLGRGAGKTLGEQARQNILAEAAQKRGDISMGGQGQQALQNSINSRKEAGLGAQTALSGQEIGRRNTAATAASQRAENLAARKMAGITGKAGFQNDVMAGQLAANQAGAGQQAELAARKAARLGQKMGLQNQLAQQQFGATGGMGQVAGQGTEQYGVSTSSGGGL